MKPAPARRTGLTLLALTLLTACGGGGGGGGGTPAPTPTPASGSLDTSFASGRAATSIGLGNNSGGKVLVQSDGKIVLAGNCVNGAVQDFCVARYNSDGSLDTGFGTGGKAMMPAPVAGTSAYVYAAALQVDGKIVLAGSCASKVCAARFNADGSTDTSFAGSGALSVTIGTGGGSGDRAEAVVMQSDGGILLGGDCNRFSTAQLCLVRLLSNGVLDAGFGDAGTGIVFTNDTSHHYGSALAVQSDGKPVWIGSDYDFTYTRFYATRYTVTGSLDTGYGSSGSVKTQVLTGNSAAAAAAMLPGNKLVIVGRCDTSPVTTQRLCAVRHNADGSLDTSFGSLGKAAIEVANFGGATLAVQADGKLLVGGTDGTGTFAVVRLTADGALDTTFGTSGKSVLLASTTDYLASVAVQSNGRIVVGGACTPSGGNRQLCASRLYP